MAHSHHRQEVRTVHWGFDSAKWRHYLLLARDEDPEKWNKALSDFKGKFDQKRKVNIVLNFLHLNHPSSMFAFNIFFKSIND